MYNTPDKAEPLRSSGWLASEFHTMKLYQVEVTYHTIILAESEADAEKQADYTVRHEADDEPQIVSASEITNASQIQQPWTPQCRPWGGLDPFDRTISQILQANKKDSTP